MLHNLFKMRNVIHLYFYFQEQNVALNFIGSRGARPGVTKVGCFLVLVKVYDTYIVENKLIQIYHYVMHSVFFIRNL